MNHLELNIPDYARQVLNRLHSTGYKAYVVGGCVRDSLMGNAPHDWDICTDCLPETTLELFQADHTVIATGLKHGTVTVMFQHQPVEVTTFRSDGAYADHRRPDRVIFRRELKDDLDRRDFTVNAMAYDPREGLMDLFGGASDLEARVIRCVGRPEDRFNEDALRILRAMRFASTLDFTIHPDTAAAMYVCKGLLSYVSAERIFTELKKLLCGRAACRILLEYREIMAQLIPELRPCFDCPQNTPHHCYDVYGHICHSVENIEPDPVLRLTMLFHDIEKPALRTTDGNGVDHFKLHPLKGSETAGIILRRLKSSNEERQLITKLVKEHDNRIPPTRKSVRRFLSKHGYDFFYAWMKVRRADTLAQSDYLREEKLRQLTDTEAAAEELLREQCCISLSDLAVNGQDMKALGLTGTDIGTALKMLLEAVVEEQVDNSREALLDYVRRNFHEQTQ